MGPDSSKEQGKSSLTWLKKYKYTLIYEIPATLNEVAFAPDGLADKSVFMGIFRADARTAKTTNRTCGLISVV